MFFKSINFLLHRKIEQMNRPCSTILELALRFGSFQFKAGNEINSHSVTPPTQCTHSLILSSDWSTHLVLLYVKPRTGDVK